MERGGERWGEEWEERERRERRGDGQVDKCTPTSVYPLPVNRDKILSLLLSLLRTAMKVWKLPGSTLTCCCTAEINVLFFSL